MSPAAVRDAAAPRWPYHRLGHLPDPLAWPEVQFVGRGRFDDPRRTFRTLYAAEQRRGCFLETLARFRPSLEALARVQAVARSLEGPLHVAQVPPDWYRKRGIRAFRLLPDQRWLDLRAAETREALRGELAHTLATLGLPDLDISSARGPNRALTQALARWAYDRGYHGIAYTSRFDDHADCWALFEGAAFEPVGPPEPISRDDPDLLAVAHLFGLAI